MSTVQIGIKEVLFGQEYRDSDGVIRIAEQDMVQQTVYIDDVPRFSIDLSPEQAMEVAHATMQTAGRIIASLVGDDGKPLGILKTLSTIAKSGRNS